MTQRETINRLQLTSLAVCFLLGSILRSVFVSHVTENDSWVIALTGIVAYAPVLFIYLSLAKRFPGKSLFEMNEAVFGAWIGRVFSALYLLFFICMAGLNIMEVGSFIVEYLMHDTPMIAVAAVFVFCCAYALRKGIESLARLAPMFAITAGFLLITSFFLSAKDFRLGHFLPAFQRPWIDYVQATHTALAVPYGESLTMMMLLPLLPKQTSPKRPFIATALITLGIMLMVHVREIIALGALLPYVALPSYEVIRMVDSANTVVRLESVYAMILITLTFFKACLIFYACVYGLAQITRAQSYRPFVPSLGLYFVTIAAVFHATSYNNIQWTVNVGPFVWTTFIVLFPALTLLVARLRRQPQGQLQAGREVRP